MATGLKICLEQQVGGQQGLQPCRVGGALDQVGRVALKLEEAPQLPQEGQGLRCGSEAAVGKLELLSLESKEGSQHRSNSLFDLE